ncbi:dolichyl-phosphate beta-glucosyltransferase-like isoform X2 [Oscarella lobularis]|uniref:dolichyl-phosphate beta-glucosyltransferase-like isoform X2 n=1 Tax=Oscarella lobularis TaxID=121494 RepID=UPI00331359D8
MAFVDFLLSLPLLQTSLVLLVILIVGLYIFLTVTTIRKPNLHRYDSEKYFLTGNGDERRPFPELDDPSSLSLSLIVPSYNEETRLPSMLDEALAYLEQKKKDEGGSFTYEIIIVDDGSKDGTSKVGMEYTKKYGHEKIRVLTFEKNRGKGGAVRMVRIFKKTEIFEAKNFPMQGMLSSRGKHLLFADADGATRFSDLTKVESALNKIAPDENTPAISVGSRSHLQDDAVAERTFLRNFLMYGFHFLVWFLCVRGVKDTQCGFKLFTRSAARLLFPSVHIDRWAFDVELLYIAQCLKISIAEVAVNWQEIEGSKMVPFWSWLQMGRDLLLIRLRYLFGLWRIKEKSN